jgi:ATP/maltotriose-dependent transcriptional regulator MalT
MPDNKIIERTEYQVKVKTSSGHQFVRNAVQTDVSAAVNVYVRECQNFMNRTKNAKVTIEKRIIITEIQDYTAIADKM